MVKTNKNINPKPELSAKDIMRNNESNYKKQKEKTKLIRMGRKNRINKNKQKKPD